ncbi:hypothetical protein COY95_03395 [Candidatus Woesearchaeota archaeon CG_4_10_14_0_8_um_filter_47_5]|nr:MAG: hypothetical protein COY95_03395 [Candidatus Woesearchaeota archaeon CG_4_10_14_0_8_um_filter_47_5]
MNTCFLYSHLKKPGYKLVNIQLSLSDTTSPQTITFIRIIGDFFMHPEEGIDALEHAITGCPFEERHILTAIRRTISTNNLVLYGISARTLTEAIMRCKPQYKPQSESPANPNITSTHKD